MPDQFEGGGEKERVAGVGKGAKKLINSKVPKKRKCPREVFGLLLGHSVIIR